MECSGTVVGPRRGCTELAVGDQVCALLAGGGYAERVAVPAGAGAAGPDRAWT